MEKFNNAYDEVKDIVLAKAGPAMLEMSTEEFGLIKAVMNFVDASMELTRAQAETINGFNYKLDRLLEK
jgi:hypothetical protein